MGFLKEAKEAGLPCADPLLTGRLCFEAEQWHGLLGRYKPGQLSEAAIEARERLRRGDRISGCCDRADQA